MEKIIRLQDAKFKIHANNNNETSIFIEQSIATSLGLSDGVEHTFTIDKENILKALSFTYSLQKDLYKKQDVVLLDEEWFKKEYDSINNHFKSTSNYKVVVSKATGDRFYLKSLKQASGLNIRNFLIQDHFKITFSALNNRLSIAYSPEPFSEVNNSIIDSVIDSSGEYLIKNLPIQKIYYGAPGTGKSHELDELIKSKNVPEEHVFRTTFHPEFTYSDFIGQLLPTVKENENGDKEISYTYNKGVFTQALEKAYEKNSNNIYLILEEMSRGDVAAIFGDTFQLLDRNKSGAENGYSRYSINNDIISKDIDALSNNKVKLPPNLSIFGTVNTSDQNVFVMDTAFKRRFEWQYISTKPVVDTESGGYVNNPTIKLSNTADGIEWVKFYLTLNKFISSNDYLDLGEDKQIGQFFIEFPEDNDVTAISNSIKNKLLQYLWSDIHKASFKRDISLFSDSISSFSELYDAFAEGKNIFSSDFIQLLNS